ncbi:MAG: 4-hydroxy-3-methylbut-2-enyl diphosphate reductase [Desulfarculaceae bacterium]|nr:4-hydroxy-3-methylbut-2-enyl diphosphate reductase [Desulfarculaceae bacterium]MCF8046896.1 4-hydroxy-3-methylbut-2-enyl diphosphate reductase [Desulfarculaceae bacterium]MCF8096388.1 4-hydroxy-3-methylbut-2-enyl diphosphate reductase [Desulfarculaceae bacterium]MCF8121933.1 4-hydroxy-3-methylbut-2-enyl diphosphate reductase [Desulfarculaceae bacterium]
MRVRLARHAGFCMGVRRAMELALAQAHHAEGPVFTYGPLIHNPQVLELLESKGIRALKEIPPPGSVTGGTVIIRAHGVPPQDKARLKQAGFSQIVEGTCPRVIRVQAIIARAAKRGADVIIVGDASHPEVVGLLGHAQGRGLVVSRPQEVDGLPEMVDVVVVAQTTQTSENFAAIVKQLSRRFGPVEVHETICEATHRRQDEVKSLAQEVDGVVVVGGRNSGNTQRLAQVATLSGKPVFAVETEEELPSGDLAHLETVGVTAGASTPNWLIKRVLRELGAIRSEREGGGSYILRRVFRFFVRSQLLVALGAAGITCAASLLQGLIPHPALAAIAFFYIYAMHILNHFLDKEAGQYNDPDRAQFLAKHRVFLIGAGIFSAAAALFLCLLIGPWPLVIVSLISLLGILYSVPVVPPAWQKRLKFASLKDIPGSKTVSAAGAWAVVVAVLPAVGFGVWQPAALALAFVYTAVLVFCRCAVFDVLDVQGDLVVGKETIPIMLGEAGTLRLVTWLLAGLAGLMLLAPLAGPPTALCLLLLAPIAGLALMQRVLSRGDMLPGALSEALVDFNFWLAGVLALSWWVL